MAASNSANKVGEVDHTAKLVYEEGKMLVCFLMNRNRFISDFNIDVINVTCCF